MCWRKGTVNQTSSRPCSDPPTGELQTQPETVIFFFDVDNTLLDNDRVTSDLHRHLEREDRGCANSYRCR